MFAKNSFKNKSNLDPMPQEFKNTLKIGLDLQREAFKESNINSDYDTMSKCLENIYNEIKSKVKEKHDKDSLTKVKKIIDWYYNLPFKFQRKTPNGIKIIYPMNIEIKINKVLNYAYQILITQLNKLKLL